MITTGCTLHIDLTRVKYRIQLGYNSDMDKKAFSIIFIGGMGFAVLVTVYVLNMVGKNQKFQTTEKNNNIVQIDNTEIDIANVEPSKDIPVEPVVKSKYIQYPATSFGYIAPKEGKYYSPFVISVSREVPSFEEFVAVRKERIESSLNDYSSMPVRVDYDSYDDSDVNLKYAIKEVEVNGYPALLIKMNYGGIAGHSSSQHLWLGEGFVFNISSEMNLADLSEMYASVNKLGVEQKNPDWNVYRISEFDVQVEYPNTMVLIPEEQYPSHNGRLR